MPSRTQLEWVVFAAVTAVASYFVAPHTTPIDRALPFVVIILAICGQARTPVLNFLIVLLLLPPILFADEHTRLLGYGVIAAIAFAVALAAAPVEQRLVFVIGGVVLLRWIPLANVVVWRELVVLVAALALFAASRSVVLALAAAAITPAFPARAMIFPFLLAALLAVLPNIRIPSVVRIPIYAVAIGVFAMWPWSGIVARAFPAFLRAEPAPEAGRPVWIALDRGESVSIDAPGAGRSVVITASGANASRLREGTLMGTVEADGMRRDIRIGDIADFGYTRREQFFRSRNSAPKRPIDDIKDYGQSAWLHTAGLVSISAPQAFQSIRVSAARDLPPGARLQIEAVHFE